ncbi:MAG TPA: hypothetical protein DEP66_05635 [Acidimicrobiaceae bacterium]|nr:hypothetical protein [Acidimicrobiaceae bacterium]
MPLTVQAWNDDNGTSVRYTSFLSLGDAPQNRNTAWLAGAVIDWKPVFAGVVDSVADGTYEPTTIWQGVAESVVQTDLPAGTPAETMPNAPAAVRAGIPALFADVLAGDIDLVFTPPPGAGAPPFPDGIATSDGRVLTPAELLSDDILGAMDFLVEGIVGADGPADRRFTS